MKKAKTLLAGLLLAASGLSHADDPLYYENAAALWDTTQAMMAFVTHSTRQNIENTKVDFEHWTPGQGWLHDQTTVPFGALRVGFSNDPRSFQPNAYLALSPWRQGAEPFRDEIYGRFLLRPGTFHTPQRYLIIESTRPLVAIGATLYNRSSQTCLGVLAPRLYSGSNLAEAIERTNIMNGTVDEPDPSCSMTKGKVDIVNAIIKKDGLPFVDTFNYAVIDMGTPQLHVSVDNVVLHFEPDSQ